MTDPTAGLGTVGAPAALPESGPVGPAGGRQGRPSSLAGDAWRDLRRNPVFLVSCFCLLVVIVMAIVPQLFTDIDPREACSLKYSLEGPTAGHPFGFNKQGCDMYAYVIYGARPSIMIGVLVAVFSSVIAVALGCVSGFYGSWLDSILQRITEIFLGMPFVLAALLVLTRLDRHDVWAVSGAFIVFAGWPTLTRVMRGNVLSLKSADYVLAARALGASDVRIMVKHILPNAIMPLLVLATILVGSTIGAEAALTFLGVGLEYPEVSWGIALNDAQGDFLTAPHLLLFPSLFLVVTVLSFILIGDAIRDAFDPRLR